MAISKLSTARGAGSTIPTAGRYAAVSGGTTTTYSSGGLTYQVQTFTGSGTLVVANCGVVDVLVIGGGGGGGMGAGAGGGFYSQQVFFPAGSYTVSVGAGGSGAVNSGAVAGTGNASAVGAAGVPRLISRMPVWLGVPCW